MKPWKSYREMLMRDLKDPEEAAGYLNAVLAEGDKEMFLVALRNIAEANGGMVKLSRKTKLSRPNLYRMLSKTGHPEIQSLHKVLNAVGLILNVSPKKNGEIRSRKAA